MLLTNPLSVLIKWLLMVTIPKLPVPVPVMTVGLRLMLGG